MFHFICSLELIFDVRISPNPGITLSWSFIDVSLSDEILFKEHWPYCSLSIQHYSKHQNQMMTVNFWITKSICSERGYCTSIGKQILFHFQRIQWILFLCQDQMTKLERQMHQKTEILLKLSCLWIMKQWNGALL